MTATDHAAATTPSTPAPGGRTLEALLAERRFLLRSIADLDAEHADGELSEERYQQLRDAYTVQAATVMRAIERLGDTDTPTTAGAWGGRARSVVTVVGVALAVVVGGGTLLVRSLNERQPGQTITGNAQSGGGGVDALAREAAARPDDPAVQIQYARELLRQRDAAAALRVYDAAARLDPTNPEPQAYAGWIVFLADLPGEALPRLDAAVALDPTYPDARFFRGMVLLRTGGDRAAAAADLREFVRLTPPSAERDQVEAILAELDRQLSAPNTTVAPP